MQILIGCAKKMKEAPAMRGASSFLPRFQDNAAMIASAMAAYSVDELQAILGVSKKIAADNKLRYQAWHDESTLTPAVMAYDGVVFNKLSAATLTPADLDYASHHLFIASFLYGLLRPLDLINPYRLEGKVVLPAVGHQSMFDYWKPLLTDALIEAVEADDGVLVNLASNEFRNMFDWRKVTQRLTVITPDFKVREGDRLKNVTIYAKMCRGAMTRYIITNRLTTPASLEAFTYEGFHHTTGYNFILD